MNFSKEFEAEVLQTIERIEKKGNEKELEWFWKILKQHFDQEYLKTQTPDIIVIGTEIPMEIIRAFSKNTFYILGGSLEAVHWADEGTPRDMDHVSQSSLGWLLNPVFDLSSQALIITTNASDSRKKMVSLLREKGKKVVVLDVFPGNDSKMAVRHYKKQLYKMIDELEKHTKTELTKKLLMQECKSVRQIRQTWNQYRSLMDKQKTPISFEIAAALMQSMYYTKDLNEWNWHMQMLIRDICKKKETRYESKNKPGIMIAGSPIIFPNLKVIQLVEDAGMEICCMADPFTIPFEAASRKMYRSESLDQTISRIAAWQVKNDASGALVNNMALVRKLEIEIERCPVEGILVHILKGQIEYDFELSAMEEIAERYDIPVFRLETDYQYQDVEQLRIRAEAFGEMLRQRRISERSAL